MRNNDIQGNDDLSAVQLSHQVTCSFFESHFNGIVVRNSQQQWLIGAYRLSRSAFYNICVSTGFVCYTFDVLVMLLICTTNYLSSFIYIKQFSVLQTAY